MMRITLLSLLVVVVLGGADHSVAQEKVEVRGVTSVIKVDEVIFRHLTELNGKFKLRATEFTFASDAYLGVHHHVGPGVRYVISGELTFAPGEVRRRSIQPATATLRQEISPTLLRIKQNCRFAYWPWRLFRKTGRLLRLLHLNNERVVLKSYSAYDPRRISDLIRPDHEFATRC